MACSQYGKRYFNGVSRCMQDSISPKAINSYLVLKQNLLLLIILWQFQGVKKMNSSTQRSPTGSFKVEGISLLSKMCQTAYSSFLWLPTTSSSNLFSKDSDSKTFFPQILIRLEIAVRQLPSNLFLSCTKISQSWPKDLGQLTKMLSVSARQACSMSLVQLEVQVSRTNSTIFSLSNCIGQYNNKSGAIWSGAILWCIQVDLIQNMRGKSIIMTSNHIDTHYIKTLKGERSDTKELNINIKTLTLSHLRHLENANELTSEQSEIVRNYAQMSACFQSINYLFFGEDAPLKLKKSKQAVSSQFQPNQFKQNSYVYQQARENIRSYCKEYFRTTYFIKNFLRSPRMNPKNKLIILKFLRKIECLPLRRFKEKSFQWKNLDFEI